MTAKKTLCKPVKGKPCKCIRLIENLLAEKNTTLNTTIPFVAHLVPQAIIATAVVLKQRGARAALVVATYCPFCGKKYPE